MRQKVKIYTLGCKVNQYDSGYLARKLENFGFKLVSKSADYAIVNTCSVTKQAMRKDREVVKKARKENPKAKIIISGCWPVNYPQEAAAMGADFVYGTNEATKIADDLLAAEAEMVSGAHGNTGIVENFDKSRYFIKIQDGCEQFCSYCIIPYNRGSLKSRNEGELIKEVTQAVEKGFHEIVLCGIHLGLYGVNRVNGKKKIDGSLVDLLRKLVAVPGIGRIRLSSIEPNEVTEELIKLMTTERKICRHLHIPLQVGTDKILKAMNRPYDMDFYNNKIADIRKAMPDIAITTDVIVGFPGETVKDFEAGLKNIKKLNLSRLHVFSFSAHEKTPAAKMPDMVDPKEISRRSKELRTLDSQFRKKFKASQKGKPQQVVIERIVGDKIYGKSEYYVDMVFDQKRVVGFEGELRCGEMVLVN